VTGPDRRFDAYELMGGEGPEPTAAELAEALLAARSLEAHASADLVQPSSGFEDRVMAAIATEPAPRAIIVAGSAVRGGRPAAFIMTLRNAWAIATRGGQPIAVRAQAFGLVLLVVVAAGSLTGVAAVGVGGLLSSQQTPSPSITAPTSSPSPVAPSASPSPAPSSSPSASPSPSSNSSAGPSPSPTTEATSSPSATGGTTPAPSRSPSATSTTRPSATPRATNSPGPTATDDSSETPNSTETNNPSETPDSTDDSGGGSSGPG
jgi:hypothetical protein